MQIIDEEGRFLGYVNIIDALVLLLVGVLVIGGVAVVVGSDDSAESERIPPSDSRLAVLDLGVQSVDIASSIEAGDSIEPGGNSNLTVTQVYVGPARQRTATGAYIAPNGDQVRLLLGVRINGVESPGG